MGDHVVDCHSSGNSRTGCYSDYLLITAPDPGCQPTPSPLLLLYSSSSGTPPIVLIIIITTTASASASSASSLRRRHVLRMELGAGRGQAFVHYSG